MNEQKLRTLVPYGKLPPEKFIRVRPKSDAAYSCWLLQAKKPSDQYLVADDLHSVLQGHVRKALIRLAVDKDGEPYLVPEIAPDAGVKLHRWNASWNSALKIAETRWVKVKANLATGSYEVFAATDDLATPLWPEESMEELVGMAFNDRVISDVGHPLVSLVLGK
jgi:hypothetical protein